MRQITNDILLDICDTIESYLCEPPVTWSEDNRAKRIYQICAVEEILKRIFKNSTDDPLDIIEGFMIETEIYICRKEAMGCDDLNCILVFKTAYETAEDLLNFLKEKGY